MLVELRQPTKSTSVQMYVKADQIVHFILSKLNKTIIHYTINYIEQVMTFYCPSTAKISYKSEQSLILPKFFIVQRCKCIILLMHPL